MRPFIYLLLVIIPYAANAEIDKFNFAVCAATPSGQDRLACYDTIAKHAGFEVPVQPHDSKTSSPEEITRVGVASTSLRRHVMVVNSDEGCFTLGDRATRLLPREQNQHKIMSWRANVTNTCDKTINVVAKLIIYDREKFQLHQAHASVIQIRAGETANVTGTTSVPKPYLQLMGSYDIDVQRR